MRYLLFLSVLLLVAACTQPADTPEVPPSEAEAVERMEDELAEAAADGSPAERDTTILIEGMEEQITLRRFVTPERFALRFSTYHPEDMLAQVISSGEGEVARFTANFGGTLSSDAMMQYRIFPVETTPQDARILTETAIENYAAWSESEAVYGWSEAEYTFSGSGLAGRMMLGRHAGRFFQIQIVYPQEMGDGFGPRIGAILDSWRWLDDGSALGANG